ncbi:MAG: hypothetical protein ACI4SM_05500 [Candidatus Gastranaerophilaceae bacterium]
MFHKKLLIIIALQILSVSSCYAVNNNEWDYKSKFYQDQAKERYQKRLMPESGYMTVEEYEKKSVAKDKSQGDGNYVKKVVPESGFKYVPQPNYKLVRYNNPPGTPELRLHRKLFFNRQEQATPLIAPDVSMMILPIVTYYAKTKSTDCDVYVVPLRQGLPDVERVIKANIAGKDPTPIFSTDRTLIEYGTFKTITPIDFSVDMTKVLAKEKIGNESDGIWQTDLLVYDFNTKKTTRLREVREAIRYYWLTTKNLDVREIRWDIYPLGFDVNNQNRVMVAAFAYAGTPPRCLGTWSIDLEGHQVRMEALDCNSVSVSINGLKLVEDGVVDPKSVEAEAKLAKKYEDKEKKEAKKAEKKAKQEIKKEYKAEVKEIKTKYKQLKNGDTSNETKIYKIHKHIPFYKVKGGKPTGLDGL